MRGKIENVKDKRRTEYHAIGRTDDNDRDQTTSDERRVNQNFELERLVAMTYGWTRPHPKHNQGSSAPPYDSQHVVMYEKSSSYSLGGQAMATPSGARP